MSELVEQGLRAARPRQSTPVRLALPPWRDPIGALLALRSVLFWTVKRTIRYLRSTVQEELATLYLPTAASVLVVVFALAFFYWRPGWQPHEIGLTDAWAWWKTPFPEKQGERALKIFEGLDLIVVAIVIFVAESVRDSANRDQRRVLLQVSYLWPLALAITLTPFGFLLGEFGGAFLALEAVLAAAALAALWRIIRNLLNVDSQRTNRKRLLKARIREAVLETVRERRHESVIPWDVVRQRLGL